MIERVMNFPIFMFTRIALSVLISASAGIIVLGFLWMLWGFADDVYNALVPEAVSYTHLTLPTNREV